MYIQAIRVPGDANAGSNGVALIYPAIAAWKVRVVISSQCYGHCSEMNVRIAHMAHVTIGLTSHAFIIDVVARCSLLHCDRRRYIAPTFCEMFPPRFLRNAGNCGKVVDDRVKVSQTCKMQIVRWFLCD